MPLPSFQSTSAWAVLATLIAAPSTAGAAQDRATPTASDLAALVIGDRQLSVGVEVRGRLSKSDTIWPDGTFAQAWALELRRGDNVTVDLMSDDFDAYLMAVGPGIPEPLSDDDGAGACDARVTFTAADNGMYRVIANTVLPGATGRFRLRVTDQPGPLTSGECSVPDDVDIDLSVLGKTFEDLPIEQRWLAVGTEVAGMLAETATASWDGSYAQAWGLELGQGTEVTVDLISEAFDAFLWILGPGIDGSLNDDDGAGACHARITFTASADGVYRVIVNSVASEATGAFTLRVSERPGPLYAGDCADLEAVGETLNMLPIADRWLEVGQELTGSLTPADTVGPDGSHVQAWGLELASGTDVTVDLVSEEFDAFLWVTGPGIEEPLKDDDGGGACHARITLTAAESGVYRVVANTLSAGATGRFVLRVSERPGPKEAGECGG